MSIAKAASPAASGHSRRSASNDASQSLRVGAFAPSPAAALQRVAAGLPPSGSAPDALTLQRTVGNFAVRRLLADSPGGERAYRQFPPPDGGFGVIGREASDLPKSRQATRDGLVVQRKIKIGDAPLETPEGFSRWSKLDADQKQFLTSLHKDPKRYYRFKDVDHLFAYLTTDDAPEPDNEEISESETTPTKTPTQSVENDSPVASEFSFVRVPDAKALIESDPVASAAVALIKDTEASRRSEIYQTLILFLFLKQLAVEPSILNLHCDVATLGAFNRALMRAFRSTKHDPTLLAEMGIKDATMTIAAHPILTEGVIEDAVRKGSLQPLVAFFQKGYENVARVWKTLSSTSERQEYLADRLDSDKPYGRKTIETAKTIWKNLSAKDIVDEWLNDFANTDLFTGRNIPNTSNGEQLLLGWSQHKGDNQAVRRVAESVLGRLDTKFKRTAPREEHNRRSFKKYYIEQCLPALHAVLSSASLPAQSIVSGIDRFVETFIERVYPTQSEHGITLNAPAASPTPRHGVTS